MPLVYEASHKFDPNQMYTSDKIVVKHISVKETLLKLDVEPTGQGDSKQQNNNQGNKKYNLLINRARLCLVTSDCSDYRSIGEQKKVNKGQELSG